MTLNSLSRPGILPEVTLVPTLSIPRNIFCSLRTSHLNVDGHRGLPDHILLEVPQYTLQHRGH